MKSCPSCNLKYADDTLQFCLSDGTGLIALSNDQEEPATIFSGATKIAELGWTNQTILGVDSLDNAELRKTSELPRQEEQANTAANVEFDSQLIATNRIYDQALAWAPIVVALAQNYWQWLYMNDSNSFQFPGFLLNLRFWTWLILLAGGATLCVLAVRQNRNKGFAVVGLVILAINFLLCLVPRK